MRSRGIFEKVPGSDEFWIRYADSIGRIRREKVGTFDEAETRLKLRREEAKLGVLPRLAWRRRPVPFRQRCFGLCGPAQAQRQERPLPDEKALGLVRR